MAPWFGSGQMPTNDPYGPHQQRMNTRSRVPVVAAVTPSAGRVVLDAAGREFVNTERDPFMSSPLQGYTGIETQLQHRRVRIKVSIIRAWQLEGSGKMDPYVICQIPGKPLSMYETPVIYNTRAPVWMHNDYVVREWIPGDSLVFSVYSKVPNFPDKPIGEATLRSEQYFPNDCILDLTLWDAEGGGAGFLKVAVQVLSVADKDKVQMKTHRLFLDRYGYISIGDVLRAFPRRVSDFVEYTKKSIDEGSDAKRELSQAVTLIGVPYLLFLLEIWLFLTVRRWWYMFVAMFSTALIVAPIFVVVLGMTNFRNHKFPWIILAGLSWIAIFAGIAVGSCAWNHSWVQWTWMQTGVRYGMTHGSTPASARSDATVLAFNNQTVKTLVDSSRAAGYRDGHMYCAAPILDTKQTTTSPTLVQYWAIGIDCCNDYGSFTCDASRENKDAVGVVMVGRGMPCAGCNAEKFQKAMKKASVTNGLVDAEGSLMVRYVLDPHAVETQYFMNCGTQMFIYMLSGLLFFGCLGYVANFQGWGKAGRFPFYNANFLQPKVLPPPVNWAKF